MFTVTFHSLRFTNSGGVLPEYEYLHLNRLESIHIHRIGPSLDMYSWDTPNSFSLRGPCKLELNERR
ncbi:hypothetical protein PM082_011598 [Marasmius tenuissimus]|nr:hypothetical protein PM082_011598 [Marasmius tenuissimus]